MIQDKEKDNILERGNLKENPFGVPSGYFSSMQDEVMAKISAIPVVPPQQYEADEAPHAGFMTYFKPAFAMAAMFGIIFGLGYGAMKITGTYTDDGSVQGTLVSANASDELSEDEVISILDITIEDLFASQENSDTIEVMEQTMSNEDIEQYLIDSRVTTTSIALLE
ncbi:MAG: hypothetical protein IJ383_06870 [Bacteroidales bacterium]|nr:hypothetical protein [Bacteroidales bacterium]